eukprot:s1179_g20.t1
MPEPIMLAVCALALSWRWDILAHDDRFFLCIREPKSRGRGPKGLKRRDRVFPGSPWLYRQRWDKLLATLGVPSDFKLTPGGLRGGGAVAAYRRGDQVSEIQWRMRLQHLGTLAFYLQEVSAFSVIPKLNKATRERIAAAATLFPFLLASRPAHDVHRP